MDATRHGSEATTQDVQVRVTPSYLPAQSDPDEPRFVFGYHVDIHNGSSRGLTVLSRRWVIIDGDGDRREVDGEGVVGLQPHIGPGETFHYASFVPLKCAWGTMEGEYHAQWDGGEPVTLTIGRFYLARPRDGDEECLDTES